MIAGFHSVALHRQRIARAIEWVAAAGYGAIELNAETLPWAAPHVGPATSAADRGAIRRHCRDAGLSISAVSAHIPMVEPTAAQRAAAVSFVNGCTDLAADLGAGVSHILSGPAPAGHDREEAWRWFCAAAEAASSHARSRGVTLAIEAIAGHLFHEVADYQRLATALPDTAICANFDPSHLVVQGEDPAGSADTLAARIVHVHIKDGAGRFPHFSFPPLGEGEIDFDGVLQRLTAHGYDGTLSVEYEANTFGFTDDEQEILLTGRAFLKRLGR